MTYSYLSFGLGMIWLTERGLKDGVQEQKQSRDQASPGFPL